MPVRRSSIVRAPLNRRLYRPRTPWRLPSWLRNLLLGLAGLAALLGAFVACDESEVPSSLAESSLEGSRRVTGGVCIEEAVDVSGSMNSFRSARESAERELFTFARRELAPGDRFSSAFFAGSGSLALAPTSMSALDSPPAVPTGLYTTGTHLAPAVRELVDARPADGDCAVRALIVITDGEITDSPPDLTATLAAANYTRVFAVVPVATGRTDLPESVEVFHFHESGWFGRVAGFFTDAEPLDVVFGEILASLTGQELRAS